MPKLSIITVNLNNAAGLQKTMESVFCQTFTDYEYIIVDGGSIDGSKELIEKHQNKFVYAVSEKDKGIYNAMNKGINKSNGEYLFFLNSGDFLYSDTSLSTFFNSENGEDILYANILKIRIHDEIIKCCPSILSFSYFLQESLPHQSTIIKKTVFDKTGLYNENLKIVADWEVVMNAVCLYQATYKHIDYCLTVFHANGISSDPSQQDLLKNERRVVISKYYGAFMQDYDKAAATNGALNVCRSTLTNIQNSRSYKLSLRLSNSYFFKLLENFSRLKRYYKHTT